jgi:hypothetical protein
MKRKLVAVGVSALALTFGAGSALGTGTTAPAGGSASQSNATTQVVPVAVAAPVTTSANVNAPVAVLGSNGDARQSNDTSVGGSASNNETDQTIVQGDHSKSTKGSGACGPKHNASRHGTTQSNRTRVAGSSTNNQTRQTIVQGRSGGSASQSNATSQILPIALAAPVTTLLNLNAPVSIGAPALPELPLVGGLLTVAGGVLADPLGAVQATLADPVGTVIGTVGTVVPALPV